MPFCCNCKPALSPIPATEDMSQAVGQRDGQLYTRPSSTLSPIPATSDMTQPVGQRGGKLFTKPATTPSVIKTDDGIHFYADDLDDRDYPEITKTYINPPLEHKVIHRVMREDGFDHRVYEISYIFDYLRDWPSGIPRSIPFDFDSVVKPGATVVGYDSFISVSIDELGWRHGDLAFMSDQMVLDLRAQSGSLASVDAASLDIFETGPTSSLLEIRGHVTLYFVQP